MTTPDEPNETLSALTTALAQEIKPKAGSRPAIYATLRDAFELGITSAAAAPPAPPVDAFGRPADPARREGFGLTVVHTVSPEQRAEHGDETAVLAYVRQTLRELEANGAHPWSDSTVAIVELEAERVIVVTGEAPV